MSAVVTPKLHYRLSCRANARHFIGERDGDKLEGLGLHEFLCPGSQRVFVRLAMIEDRMRAHDEQFPQISIAHLRDAAQSLLAAGRVLFRRQAKKGGELARARESGDILNARG